MTYKEETWNKIQILMIKKEEALMDEEYKKASKIEIKLEKLIYDNLKN